ncbi:MAG: cytochrome c [Acetobacteraceae bacterium]|nr:cytochrome c [Acetobacteraceae bacterium]
MLVHSRVLLLAACTSAAMLSTASAAWAEDPPQPPEEVKKLFAAQCSWCHGAYGMKADKGPRLAGTEMTEKQVHDRILNGKPGLMPSFRKVLTEEQITEFVKYIKSLKPED